MGWANSGSAIAFLPSASVATSLGERPGFCRRMRRGGMFDFFRPREHAGARLNYAMLSPEFDQVPPPMSSVAPATVGLSPVGSQTIILPP